MTVYDIRVENLRRVMNERFERKQALLADAVDKKPNYISFIFTKRKKIGETLARQFETRLGLEEFSLDKAHATGANLTINYASGASRLAVKIAERALQYSSGGTLSDEQAKPILDLLESLGRVPRA